MIINLMGILVLIVLGIVAGIIAKMIIPGATPGGYILTALLGIAGSNAGGYLSYLLGLGEFGALSLMSILWSIAGAVVLLVIYHFIVNKKH